MYKYILAVILLAALCLPLACTDKSTDSNNTVVPTDTLVVRDIDYAQRVIYDLGRLPIPRAASDSFPEPDKYDFVFADSDLGIAGDSIIRAILYVDDLSGDTAARFARPVGRCDIDPEDTLSDDSGGIYRTNGYFETVDAADYYLHPTRFFAELFGTSIGVDDIIAVYMEVLRRRPEGTWIDTVGDISSDTMKLKLIKPTAYLDVNNHIWEYEWRNIYDLSRTNFDGQYFRLEIYHGQPLDNDRIDPADSLWDRHGWPYITITGLDRGDDTGQGVPDGEIDRYVYVDQALGLLFFPSRHPFDDSVSYVTDDYGDPVRLIDSVPAIYNDNDPAHLPAASRYYMGIFYRRP